MARGFLFAELGRVIGVTAFLLTCCSGIAADRPNILFIAIDDLRNQLGHLGATNMVTPHRVRLAANEPSEPKTPGLSSTKTAMAKRGQKSCSISIPNPLGKTFRTLLPKL